MLNLNLEERIRRSKEIYDGLRHDSETLTNQIEKIIRYNIFPSLKSLPPLDFPDIILSRKAKVLFNDGKYTAYLLLASCVLDEGYEPIEEPFCISDVETYLEPIRSKIKDIFKEYGLQDVRISFEPPGL